MDIPPAEVYYFDSMPDIVSRFTNGGFIMQSCWVVYISFPMPPMGACAALEDAALDVTTETMSAEAMRYSIFVVVLAVVFRTHC